MFIVKLNFIIYRFDYKLHFSSKQIVTKNAEITIKKSFYKFFQQNSYQKLQKINRLHFDFALAFKSIIFIFFNFKTIYGFLIVYIYIYIAKIKNI